MFRQISLLLLAAALFAGCASFPPVASRHKAPKHAAFTVENYDSALKSHAYTYAEHPRRIVALWQNSVETLIALGAGDRIIAAAGITSEKHLAPEHLESYMSIPTRSRQVFSQEALMLMRPDFILGWLFDFSGKGRSIGTTDFWEGRGANVYMNLMNGAEFKEKHTLEDEIKYIEDVGKIVGKERKAAELVGGIREAIAGCREKLEHKAPARVLLVASLGKAITIYTPRTLPGDLVTRLGGRVMGDDMEAVGLDEFISYEDILMLQPDMIFLQVAPESAESALRNVYSHPALKNLRCVRQKHVYTVPFYAIRSPGIRVKDAVEVFAEALESYAGDKA